MKMKRYKLAVVGAGAAGLMAACQAGKVLGPEAVALLEGNPKPGKKLLATGNGRCNLTNLHISSARYHGDVSLAKPLLSACPPERVLKAFSALGLHTRADGEGRVYPYGLQAAAVLQALRGSCEEGGAALFAGFPVTAIAPRQGGFFLQSPEGMELWAEKCLLACGGAASPRHSCQEGGYALAKRLGHSLTPLRPGLTPLACPKKLTSPLKGMRCKAKAALWIQGRKVYAESGEVLFGEGSLSGICIFNLSLRLSAGQGEVALDLLEGMEERALFACLENLRSGRPRLPSREIFSGLVNLRIGQQIAKNLGFTEEKQISALSREDLRRAARAVKDWRLPVSPWEGWDSAQITAGGVPLSEVNMKTMESRRQPGLYLAGELLNLHGDCGGYNLHWAWATGMTAGLAAGR